MVVRDFTKFLKEHFGDTSNLVGVEVGVWQGDNALSIFEYLKPKLLLLVDAWNETVERSESQEDNFLSTYRKFADCSDVILVKGKSEVVAGLLLPCFDFVYIDANHGEARTDIECWYPLVKKGGILGGHDYNLDGVYVPVNKRFPKVSYAPEKIDGVTWQGIDWWVIK